MYKLGGRGGGRGSKRPPAPHGRGRGASSSMGGLGPPPRGRAAAAAAAPAAQAEGREESFSLESSGPPAFAAVVRLTPDLIDEIRRAEEAGGGARIMFNSNINPAENIIDVDGKEFNFTWSSEPGELCDIYEERQSGEGGNGLLMEHGSSWRKVNVQRILDESAKNQVKMRSEEAERLSKSRNSSQQQPEPNFQDISTQSWYPPSVVGSSSHPSTPTSSSASTHQRASDHPQSSSRGQPSPAEAAGIIALLKDKSVDELQRLLKDKEAYNAFFNSRDQVKTQNNLRGELRRETLQLARENLEREQRISELRNQCTIIRTTELAAAEDRLADLERQKDEIMRSYSPAALLDKLQNSMAKLDEESEELHQKFLEKDIDLPTFVQKYKKLRTAHHKCALIHLSGTTSLR